MVSPLNKEGLIQGMTFEASDNRVVWVSVFLGFLPVRLELSGSDRFTSENDVGQDVVRTFFQTETCRGLHGSSDTCVSGRSPTTVNECR